MFGGVVVEFFPAGAVRGIRKHVRIGRKAASRPERFQNVVVCPSLGTEAQVDGATVAHRPDRELSIRSQQKIPV
jgi:hypothetical protein